MHLRHLLPAMAMAILFATTPLCAQDNWVRFTPTQSPTVRQFHAMAFDAVRREFVLFGGFNASFSAIGDTWTFDGTTWTRRFPTNSPAARGGHRMVFDAARGEVVLFGGGASFGSATYADLWTWNGTNWTARSAVPGPTARFEPTLTYDVARQQVILFGGQSPAGLSAETWALQGTTWTRLFPTSSPTARSGAMSTYDVSRQRIVLFGGGTVGGSNLRRDIWEWDGANWTDRTPLTTPVARFRGGLAYDPAQRRCLLFGGFTPFRNDTWSWDGATGSWTQLAPATVPLARDAFGFEFDPDRVCIYMFGGDGSSTAQNDSWRYCSRGFVRSFGTACRGNANTLPTLSATAPSVGSQWSISLQTGAPNQPAFLFAGVSNLNYAGLPLPFDLTPLGFSGCELLVSLDLTLNAMSDATGLAVFQAPIPAQLDLIGAQFYLQGTTSELAWSAGAHTAVGH